MRCELLKTNLFRFSDNQKKYFFLQNGIFLFLFIKVARLKLWIGIY